MLDALIFAIVFGGFFVVRAIAATVVFYYLLPQSDRCPVCDEHTVRVKSPAWNFMFPWFRTSWCYRCGWEGLLRPTSGRDEASTESQSGQLPVSSKKSS